MYLIANLPLTLTVKEFIKLVNISQSYEQILSSTFFMAHGVLTFFSFVPAVTVAHLPMPFSGFYSRSL